MPTFSDLLPPETPARLRTGQLAKLLGISRVTVHDWVKRGRLPQPLRLSKKICLHDTAAVRQALCRTAEGGAA